MTLASLIERVEKAEAGPFVMGRCGGSRRTGICQSATSTAATTAAGNPSAHAISSLDRGTSLFSDQLRETPRLFGDAQSTVKTASKASSAASSATKDRTSRPSLSDRLTRSLITAGLVCGITPSSIRHLSGQPIRVLAFGAPDGGDVASLSAACSSSNGSDVLTVLRAKSASPAEGGLGGQATRVDASAGGLK